MIKSNDVGFYKTIKKNKLKIFTSMLMIEKVAVKETKIVIRADRVLLAWLLVIRGKSKVSMKDFLRYSLGPVAWPLATPIGNAYKSTKRYLINMLGKENQSGQSNTSWYSKSVWQHVYHPPFTNRFWYFRTSIWLCPDEDYIQ